MVLVFIFHLYYGLWSDIYWIGKSAKIIEQMVSEPTHSELVDLFDLKYRRGPELGWSPALRKRYDYFNPDDVYEALARKIVRNQMNYAAFHPSSFAPHP